MKKNYFDILFPGKNFWEKVKNEARDFFIIGEHRKEFLIMGVFSFVLLLYVLIQESRGFFSNASWKINGAFFLLGGYFVLSDMLKRKKILAQAEQFFLDAFFYSAFMGVLIVVTGGQASPIAHPLVFLMAMSAPIYGTMIQSIVFLFAVLSVYLLFVSSAEKFFSMMTMFHSSLDLLALFSATLIIKFSMLSLEKKEDENRRLYEDQIQANREIKMQNRSLEKIVDEKTKALGEQIADISKHNKILNNSKIAMINILDDVQFEKRKSERLTKDLEKFQLAVAGSSDHMVITDTEGIILYMNKAAELITGYSIVYSMGKKAGSKELWGGNMPKDFYAKFWKKIKKEKKIFSGEVLNTRRNGENYTAEVSITPIIGEDKKVRFFVGIERDITENKKNQESLSRLAAIVRDSKDGIMGEDLNGRITYWNEGAEVIYGYKEAEVMGKPVSMLMPKEYVEESKNILESIKRGEAVDDLQTVRIRKDGSIIDITLSSSPIRDAGNNIIGISKIARDVTREKQIDKAKTEFVSLASHQLRTPLTAIKWNAEIILEEKMPEDIRSYIDQIYQSNERMIELVNGLLNVSRVDMGSFAVEPEKIQPLEIVDSVIKELEPLIVSKELKVETKYETENATLDTDKKLFRIIVQNLLSNAVKYTKEKGKVFVSVKKEEDKFIFSIKDSGIGIPKKQQERIFSKLFRAENAVASVSDGTGLGLYVTKAVIGQLGGNIRFESVEDKGTTFFFDLPIAGAKKKEGNKELSAM